MNLLKKLTRTLMQQLTENSRNYSRKHLPKNTRPDFRPSRGLGGCWVAKKLWVGIVNFPAGRARSCSTLDWLGKLARELPILQDSAVAYTRPSSLVEQKWCRAFFRVIEITRISGLQTKLTRALMQQLTENSRKHSRKHLLKNTWPDFRPIRALG